MAEISPFRALRYDEPSAGPLAELISPPYDVISEELRARLYARSPHNLVRVEYGRDEAGDPLGERYARAARSVEAWTKAGLLKRDPTPAFYPLEHHFALGSERVVRRGFFAALRLYPTEAGIVRPHEFTFPKAKSDRLDLLRATRLNVSPVFGMFADAEERVRATVDGWTARGGAPRIADVVIGDERFVLWKIDDDVRTAELASLLSTAPVYLADGHHRYETALTYRDERGEGDPAAGSVLIFLCPLEDPGLRIFPTHRIVRGGDAAIDAAIATSFDATDGAAAVVPDERRGIVVVRDDRSRALCLRDGVDLSALPAVWRPLPVAQAERLLIDPARAAGGTVEYEHDARVAIAAARENATAVLLRAVDPTTLREVMDAGERLPQKTTYFYPKVPAGLVLRPLEP